MEIVCKNCKQLKKHGAFGLCKSCYMKEYWEKNKEKLLQQHRIYNNLHKEEIAQQTKRYRELHKNKIKTWRLKNREQILQHIKRGYHNNIDGKTHICRGANGKSYIRCRGGKPLHRVIAEEVLERRLKSYEVVHHLDENTLNNEHSNLIICTREYHAWLHQHKYNNKKSVNKC